MSSCFALVKPITMLGGMEPESAKMCIEMVGAITIAKPSYGYFRLFRHTE